MKIFFNEIVFLFLARISSNITTFDDDDGDEINVKKEKASNERIERKNKQQLLVMTHLLCSVHMFAKYIMLSFFTTIS